MEEAVQCAVGEKGRGLLSHIRPGPLAKKLNALPATSVTVQGPTPVSYVLVWKWSRCDSVTARCFAWRTFFAL